MEAFSHLIGAAFDQQQADAEQKKYDTEIQKTMIAAQSKNQPRQS